LEFQPFLFPFPLELIPPDFGVDNNCTYYKAVCYPWDLEIDEMQGRYPETTLIQILKKRQKIRVPQCIIIMRLSTNNLGPLS
jgi:hypothetical protein